MGLGLWFVCRCVGERVLWGLLLVCVGVRVFVCLCLCVLFSLCVFCFALFVACVCSSFWVCSSVSVLLRFLVRFLVF